MTKAWSRFTNFFLITKFTIMKALEFIYQDTEIAFLLGTEKNVMVNATEMAKAFGKRTSDFLQLVKNDKKQDVSFIGGVLLFFLILVKITRIFL